MPGAKRRPLPTNGSPDCRHGGITRSLRKSTGLRTPARWLGAQNVPADFSDLAHGGPGSWGIGLCSNVCCDYSRERAVPSSPHAAAGFSTDALPPLPTKSAGDGVHGALSDAGGECLRGKVGRDRAARVPRPPPDLRAAASGPGAERVLGALPRRATPSGPRTTRARKADRGHPLVRRERGAPTIASQASSTSTTERPDEVTHLRFTAHGQ
jgi:hypothetical protein